jgi:hypothetical protein
MVNRKFITAKPYGQIIFKVSRKTTKFINKVPASRLEPYHVAIECFGLFLRTLEVVGLNLTSTLGYICSTFLTHAIDKTVSK